MSFGQNLTVYGFNNPLQQLFPLPVIAKRAPTANDNKFLIGQVWIEPVNALNVPVNGIWVLTSIINNQANWADLSGAAGVFTSLTVNPGPTNLSTVGNGNVTIGNAGNTGLILLNSGPGNISLRGNGNVIAIGADNAANTVNVGTLTNGALTTISAGNTTGIGTAAMLLQTAPAGDIQIGKPDHTGTIFLGTSTAGDIVDIAGGINTALQTVNILDGATAANAIVSILSGAGTAGTASLLLADNPAVTLIDLGNIAPTAARATTIAGGDQAVNDTVSILNGNPSAGVQTFNLMSGIATGGTQAVNLANVIGGALTVAIANGANTTPQVVNISSGNGAANSDVNILTGVATAGVQTLNVLTGLLSTPGAVNIATGTAAHIVSIGSITGAAATTINGGTGGIALAPTAGNISAVPAAGGAASPVATAVMNNRLGSATFTGFTTASGVAQIFTITNATVLATSAIFCTVSNVFNANDAQMTLIAVVIAAAGGSFDVHTFNSGTQALDGNVIINFWVMS